MIMQHIYVGHQSYQISPPISTFRCDVDRSDTLYLKDVPCLVGVVATSRMESLQTMFGIINPPESLCCHGTMMKHQNGEGLMWLIGRVSKIFMRLRRCRRCSLLRERKSVLEKKKKRLMPNKRAPPVKLGTSPI